jgi:large subunit ribosomal protein L20
MTRVTRGFVAKKRRKKVLKLASGFTGANNRLYRTAQQRTLRALSTAYRDRRLMKRTIRSVWIRRINCFLKNYTLIKSGFADSTSFNNMKLGRGMASGVPLEGATAAKPFYPDSSGLVSNGGAEPTSNRNKPSTLPAPRFEKLSYSIFISKLKKHSITLNRKILSQLSIFDTNSMQKIIQTIQ